MTSLEQAYSKWIALQPLDEQVRYKISQRFTIDFNYNSNHIEGNTLTYGQTEVQFATIAMNTRGGMTVK